MRVLPGLESIGLCEKAGIRGKQILAMAPVFGGNESGNDPSVFDLLSGYKSQRCAQRISGKTCGSAESRDYGMRDRETGTGTGNVLCTGNRNTFPSA